VSHLIIEQVASRPMADRWQAVHTACAPVDHRDLPADPVAAVYERIESQRRDEARELWLGRIGDVPLVAGEITMPLLDNRANAVVDVRTHPEFRRGGHATAMFEQLATRAREYNRTTLMGFVCDTTAEGGAAATAVTPGAFFATKVGARPVTTEIRRRLRLADIDDVQLDRLRSEAMDRSAGYSVLQWEAPAPAEFLDDLARLEARLSTDAPLEQLDWEPEDWNAARYREREASMAAADRCQLTAAARHDASGRLVALTEIGIARAQPEIAFQWATIVDAAHRGHRLGMLIKLANLDALRANWPRVQSINTWNAGVNDHMVAINEAMGFQVIEQWREWQLDITSQA
jgi:GNAT superfamily N-acetyltransferase